MVAQILYWVASIIFIVIGILFFIVVGKSFWAKASAKDKRAVSHNAEKPQSKR